MPRGNPYARGGDPMKTRSERRREKQVKLSKTKRVIRLKRRLGRIAAKKFAGQEDSHMTALMESYILRRKAERAAEKAQEEQGEGAAAAAAAQDATDAHGEYSEEEDEEGESGSDAFSLGSAEDDSAFEMDGSGEDDRSEEEDADVEDIAASRRRAAEAKRHRGGGGRGRGGNSWNSKKEFAAAPKRYEGRGGASPTQRGRGRGGRGGGAGGRGRGGHRGGGSGGYQQRNSKVATRSLY